jgi:hypothetical protein
MVDQHQRKHGLGNRRRTNTDARVVASARARPLSRVVPALPDPDG